MSDETGTGRMRTGKAWLRRLAADLRIGLLFATRLPLPLRQAITGRDIARASWTLPIVGALIGLLSALIFAIAFRLALPPLVVATLAVAASLGITGCLHEDGLADVCDALGGVTRERKLEIMRDSRIGAFGACALILSLLLRVGAIASFATPAQAALALIAAHAGARALLPALLLAVPPARMDGLSADTGRPPAESVLAALLIGLAALFLCLGLARSLAALILLLITFAFMRALCLSQFGGQSGDTAGALEQLAEIAILMVAVDRA
ncbi:MAG TPA: adenosylcobinamide-GDP ribazoletransferase [Xanthobacteraceae bacterium]|nr:adenosylcobinamide-GDP ribazoletransferase [Xanthobacteraceae bacterium]